MSGLKRVAVIIGTRPEAIKLAPVIQALREDGALSPWIIATAQHRDMLDAALAETGLTPDIDLDLMSPGQTLSAFSAACLQALGHLFERDRADYVIGQGDTNTAFVAALAAFHARIGFGHVEAGLRSGRSDTPFPEEMNRRMVSLLARHHFCPRNAAEANLLREGIAAETIHVTGNTAIDTLLSLSNSFGPPSPHRRHTMLVTVHRRENFEALPAITAAVRTLLDRFPDLHVRWPVHPNPQLGTIIHATLGDHPRVELTRPLPYRSFVAAMREARLILSDSGGVQEEAPALGTPVLVLRNETERPEGVFAGVSRLVGNDPQTIVPAAACIIEDDDAHLSMSPGISPYGDGQAAQRIARIVRAHLAPAAAFANLAATG